MPDEYEGDDENESDYDIDLSEDSYEDFELPEGAEGMPESVDAPAAEETPKPEVPAEKPAAATPETTKK